MFVITPLLAVVLASTFWTGVAVTASSGQWEHSADVHISATTTDHQDACAARYHSYRSDMDSWLGRDGKWHVCML